MTELGVWHNGVDWVIATDPDDARAIEREQYGDMDDSEIDCDGWRRLDDDEEFTMIDVHHDWLDARARTVIPPFAHITATAKASDWVKHCGRGWLASTEW